METHDQMDVSCEPMDVDQSASSPNISLTKSEDNTIQSAPKLTPPKSEKTKTWKKRTYHIKRDRKKTKEARCSRITLFLMGLTVMVLSVIIYWILDIKCCDSLDLEELRLKLENRLYGQPGVIDNLIESLHLDVDTKILFLFGGTGVGKTLTISLALENFWNSSNVYHYTMPSFSNTFSTDTMIGLSFCESSIVVIDDLKQNDLDVKKQVAEIIKKSRHLNKKITIILIFNCNVITSDFVKTCDENFYLDLSQAFNDVEGYKSYIRFKPLTQGTLKMCIDNELKGKSLNDIDYNNILHNFNVTLDGCKGVYKKIKFLNML